MDKLQRNPRLLLIAGIVLRVVTYCFLEPTNLDQHFAVIQFIVDHGRLPATADMGEGQQPPLYYLLGAVVWKLSGSEKVVQLLSLAFSIGTLAVLYWLITKTPLLESSVARLYSLLLACFLPQFVVFGLYVSNDSLAVLVGCLVFAQAYRFIESPGRRQLLLLAAVSGIGIATKASFLPFMAVLSVLVFSITYCRTRLWSRSFLAVLTFTVVVSALGGYKYIDNYVRYRNPIANVLDARFGFAFVGEQAAGYKGIRSLLDVNILRLIASPSLSESTQQAYPLLFYATFWYPHIPESNLGGSHRKPLSYLGSGIYILALFPTFLIFSGMFWYLKHLPDLRSALVLYGETDRLLIMRYVAVMVLFALLVFLAVAVVRYHVWSMPQGRLLFPGLFAIVVAFSKGVEVFRSNRRAMAALMFDVGGLSAVFLVYFLMEYSLIVLRVWFPGLRNLIKAL
jgi:hypothetical protein